MAREAGLSQTAVSRIWRAFGLQPHRQETFKLSTNPLFVEKVRDITVNRLRRGVFTSVPELVTAIDEYIAHHNTKPKPFIWTKSAADILQKVIRANSRLSSKQNATLH